MIVHVDRLQLMKKLHNPIQNFYLAKNVMKDGQIVPEIIETKEKVAMPEKSPFK